MHPCRRPRFESGPLSLTDTTDVRERTSESAARQRRCADARWNEVCRHQREFRGQPSSWWGLRPLSLTDTTGACPATLPTHPYSPRQAGPYFGG